MLYARGLLLAAGAIMIATVSAGDFDVTVPAQDGQSVYLPTMTAVLTPAGGVAIDGGGTLDAVDRWTSDGQAFRTFTVEGTVTVPNKLQGFWTLEDAMNADVRVRLARKGLGDFAECLLTVQPTAPVPAATGLAGRFAGFDPVDAEQWITPTYEVTYVVSLVQQGEAVRPLQGVCDIDLYQRGLQIGIPTLETSDLVTVMNEVEGSAVRFLDGYCE